MDILRFLLIPMLIFIGYKTSVEDINENKVRNKWVLMGLIYGISLTVFLSTIAYINTGTYGYLLIFILNLFFSGFSAIIIWLAGLWPPGDAKLFIAYSTLIPLSFYKWTTIHNFPTFSLLINTFIPLFIFYFIKLISKTTYKDKINIIKSFKPKLILENLIFIIPIIWLMGKLGKLFNSAFFSNLFVIIVFIFLIFYYSKKFLKKNLLKTMIAISLIIVVLDSKVIFTTSYLYNLLIVFFYFIFIRYFIINLSILIFSKTVFIEDLKPDMILVENYYKELGHYYKRAVSPVSFVNALMDHSGERVIKNLAHGLTKEDIKQINKLHSTGEIDGHELRVASTLPFAPFLFSGAVLTILAQGNIIVVIVKIIDKFI